MSNFTEDEAEDATLEWFAKLGHERKGADGLPGFPGRAAALDGRHLPSRLRPDELTRRRRLPKAKAELAGYGY